MSKSARQIQEDLFQRGLIDGANQALNPIAIHGYCYDNGVAGPELESALGWQQGLAAAFVIAYNETHNPGLPHLTGDTGINAPPPPPPRSEYGSGFEGTPAPAAPPAVVYGPEDLWTADDVRPPATALDRRAEFLAWNAQAGWKLPGDELPLWYEGRRRGFTPAEAEEWLGAESGSIERVARERGLIPAPVDPTPTGGGGPTPVK